MNETLEFTREEVEFALERQKVIVELERFAKENNNQFNQPDWYLVYNYSAGGVIWVKVETSYPNIPTSLLFSNNWIAAQAVEVVGEERLKKYYFGITD